MSTFLMHAILPIKFHQRCVSRHYKLLVNVAYQRLTCMFHQTNRRSSSTGSCNECDENATKPTFNSRTMRNDSLRTTLQTLHSSYQRKTRPRKMGGKRLADGDLEVQIRYNNDNHPFVVISVGKKSYYINPFPNFLRFMASNNTGTPVLSDVIFTRLNWTSAFTILPQILNNEQFNRTETVSVYGPPGVGDMFSLSVSLLFSVKAREQHKNKLIFHEYYGSAVNAVESNPLKVFIVNIAQESFTSSNQTVSSNTCSDTVSGYIFEYTANSRQKANRNATVGLCSWSDFSTIEEYMEYIKKLKSNLSEHEINSSKATFAFLDLPNSAYFDEMLKENYFHFHHVSHSKLSCIFHMGPPELYYSSKYQMWIKTFGPMCKHLLISEKNTFRMFNYKLECYRGIYHTLQPQFFPLHGNKHCMNILQDVFLSAVPFKNAIPLEVYHLRHDDMQLVPKKRFPEHISKSNPLSDLVPSKSFVLPEQNDELAKDCYPKVVVLGSGGASVSLSRASPCFLLQLNKETSILLDCGGNTIDQLERHFGVNFSRILSTIKIIVISHKHNDHWVGLLGLLHKIQPKVKDRNRTVIVLPDRLENFFKNHCSKDERQAFSKVKFFRCEDAVTKINLHRIAQIDIKRITLVPVDHGVPTFGVVIECLDGKKIVYSSDTLPLCDNLIKEGNNADLLIHDSLYVTDEGAALASFKMHSTMQGAVATAHKMNAKNLMLTHFTSGINVVPTASLQISEPYNGNVLYAVDHLEISLAHLKYFSCIHDSLKEVFPIANKRGGFSGRKVSDLLDLYGTISKEFVEN